MTELEQFTDGEIFDEYERRVARVADDIAEELNEKNAHDSIDGRAWCEERGIPESVFSDAVNYFLADVTWGVSPMNPMRIREGTVENLYNEIGEEETQEVTEE